MAWMSASPQDLYFEIFTLNVVLHRGELWGDEVMNDTSTQGN